MITEKGQPVGCIQYFWINTLTEPSLENMVWYGG